MRSTAITLAAFLAALSGGMARAGVIDTFDSVSNPTVVNSNYTGVGGGTLHNVSSGSGYSGLAPVAGAGLGKAPEPTAGNRCELSVWNGSENVNMGDTIDVWVAPTPDFYTSGGAIVKTFTDGAAQSGAYVIGVAQFGATQARFVVGIAIAEQVAGPFYYPWEWPALTGHTEVGRTNFTPTSAWYHVTGTISAVGSTVQIAYALTTGTPGSETPVLSGTWTDSGANAATSQGQGKPGLWCQSWGTEGVDFDNLSYVPEPATLGLLVVGGLAMLKRRRAIRRQSGL